MFRRLWLATVPAGALITLARTVTGCRLRPSAGCQGSEKRQYHHISGLETEDGRLKKANSTHVAIAACDAARQPPAVGAGARVGGAAAEAVQPGEEELEEAFAGVESASAYGDDDVAAEGGPLGSRSRPSAAAAMSGTGTTSSGRSRRRPPRATSSP
jgi:hypothetical protein